MRISYVMAAGPVAIAQLRRARHYVLADLRGARAARHERAATALFGPDWNIEGAALGRWRDLASRIGHRLDQQLSVGMRRGGGDGLARTLLDHMAGVEHRGVFGEVARRG